MSSDADQILNTPLSLSRFHTHAHSFSRSPFLPSIRPPPLRFRLPTSLPFPPSPSSLNVVLLPCRPCSLSLSLPPLSRFLALSLTLAEPPPLSLSPSRRRGPGPLTLLRRRSVGNLRYRYGAAAVSLKKTRLLRHCGTAAASRKHPAATAPPLWMAHEVKPTRLPRDTLPPFSPPPPPRPSHSTASQRSRSLSVAS